MDGTFACPECGCEIRLKGLSPGREVRCGWCQAWVVVPFLPRADQIKRMRGHRARGRRRRLPVWVWAAAGVLSVAIAVAAASRVVRSRWRSADAEAIARLVETSRQAEAAGRLDEALAAMEGALTLARRVEPASAAHDDFRRQRERLARREAEARLSALDSGGTPAEPGRAVGHALILLARARKDPALTGLEDRIEGTLERLRLRWAEADATAARTAEEDGQLVRSLEFCQRLARTADDLSPEPRKRWRGEAEATARRLISRYGAVVDPVRGQFSLGSPLSHAALLNPLLADRLRGAGYLPRPPQPTWDEFWTALAPYRVGVEIVERQDDTYLQSPNRLSQIEATLSLSRLGHRLWRDTARGRTQVPLPGLPAYQASRLAVGAHRSPDFERLLYNDARGILYDRLVPLLRNLPSSRSP